MLPVAQSEQIVAGSFAFPTGVLGGQRPLTGDVWSPSAREQVSRTFTVGSRQRARDRTKR